MLSVVILKFIWVIETDSGPQVGSKQQKKNQRIVERLLETIMTEAGKWKIKASQEEMIGQNGAFCWFWPLTKELGFAGVGRNEPIKAAKQAAEREEDGGNRRNENMFKDPR